MWGRTASATPSRGDEALTTRGTAGVEQLNERTHVMSDQILRSQPNLGGDESKRNECWHSAPAEVACRHAQVKSVVSALHVTLWAKRHHWTPSLPQHEQVCRAQQSKVRLCLRPRLQGYNRRRVVTTRRLRGTWTFGVPRHQPDLLSQRSAPQPKPAMAIGAVGGGAE